MPTATLDSPRVFPVKGGQYKAEPDGRPDGVVIRRVPIFGEVEPGERGNEKHIGRDWHLRALAAAKAGEQHDEYLPPLHVGHHDGITQVRRAGFCRLVDVGEITYRGKTRSVIFADLHVDKATAESVRRFELPYCSIEAGYDWDEPEVLSLALLDHEPPHFRHPLITLSEDSHFAGRPERVVTFFYDREREDEMPDDPTKSQSGDDNDVSQFSDDEPETEQPTDAAPPADVPDDAPADPAMSEVPEPAPDPSQPPPWIPAAITMLVDALQGGGSSFAETEPGDQPPAVDVPAHMAGKKGKPMGDKPNATDTATNFGNIENHPQFKRVRSELAQLKAKDEARDRADKIRIRTERAFTTLRESNVHLTEKITAKIQADARISDEAVNSTVEMLVDVAADSDPLLDLDGPSPGARLSAVTHPDLQAFAAKGADVLNQARSLHAEWQEYAANGGSMNFKQYAAQEGLVA